MSFSPERHETSLIAPITRDPCEKCGLVAIDCVVHARQGWKIRHPDENQDLSKRLRGRSSASRRIAHFLDRARYLGESVPFF